MRVLRLVTTLVLAGSVALVAGVTCRSVRPAPLPRYELQLEGGRATYLAAQRVPALDAESLLSITLRPERATPRRVVVSAVVSEESRQRAWPVVFERTPQGTLRLQGPLRELHLPCVTNCTITLYISDFVLLPALLWLVPEAYRSRLLPRTQTLQANVRIEPTIRALGR